MEMMNDLLHDDYEFTLHSAGKILSKQDVIDWVASDDIVTSNNRILYENDEIGVNHAVVTFKSDGNVQGVLAFLRYKDGKIWKLQNYLQPKMKIKYQKLNITFLKKEILLLIIALE